MRRAAQLTFIRISAGLMSVNGDSPQPATGVAWQVAVNCLWTLCASGVPTSIAVTQGIYVVVGNRGGIAQQIPRFAFAVRNAPTLDTFSFIDDIRE
jgi:hypothetical protein